MKRVFLKAITHAVATAIAVVSSGAIMLVFGLLSIVVFGDNPVGETAVWYERLCAFLWVFVLATLVWGLNLCAYFIFAPRIPPFRFGRFNIIVACFLGLLGVSTIGVGIAALTSR